MHVCTSIVVYTQFSQWHIDKHPCYKYALADVNTANGVPGVVVEVNQSSDRTNGTVATNFDTTRPATQPPPQSVFASVPFPPTEDARYGELHGPMMLLIEHCKKSKITFQRTKVQINHMLAAAQKEADGPRHATTHAAAAAAIQGGIMPLPPRDRGAGHNESTVNNANKKRRATSGRAKAGTNARKKKGSTATCKTCQRRGIEGPHGHRKGGNCPNKNKWCTHCLRLIPPQVTDEHEEKNCPNHPADSATSMPSSASASVTLVSVATAGTTPDAASDALSTMSPSATTSAATTVVSVATAGAGAQKCSECKAVDGHTCEWCKSAIICRLCCHNRGVAENLIRCRSCYEEHGNELS